jgi:hypothetical protein
MLAPERTRDQIPTSLTSTSAPELNVPRWGHLGRSAIRAAALGFGCNSFATCSLFVNISARVHSPSSTLALSETGTGGGPSRLIVISRTGGHRNKIIVLTYTEICFIGS